MTQTSMIKVAEIYVDDSFNCRGSFSDSDITDLKIDIRKNGLLQNIIVSPLPLIDSENPYKYALVAGFRRLRAVKALGWELIEARIENLTEKERLLINLTENLTRKNLNILQEATALQHLMDIGISEKALPDVVHQSSSWVNVRLALLKLPPDIQEKAILGELTNTQILNLVKIPLIYDQREAVRFIELEKQKRINLKLMDTNKPETKRQRKVGELTEMGVTLREIFGSCLEADVISWAAGFIDNKTLYAKIKARADELQIDYEIPNAFL